jgi:hypothetical protein
MDAKTELKSRQSHRQVTAGFERATCGSSYSFAIAPAARPRQLPIRRADAFIAAVCNEVLDAAVQLPAITGECGTACFDGVEIFKKTPCIAGLQPGSRDVAKDILDSGNIPLLKTFVDQNYAFTHPGGAYEKQCYADI